MTDLLRHAASAALSLALLAMPATNALAQSDTTGNEEAAEPTQDGAASAEAADEAPSPDTVIAVVNGREITEGDLALVPPPQGQPLSDEQRRALALSQIIDLRAVAAAGEAAGVADEAFERSLLFQRDRQLATEFLRTSVSPQLTEEKLRERYEKEVSAVPPTEEVRASHILVETEEEAKAIIAELDGGADFAELAKEKSTGPSGPNGGDLGFFGPGRMVPAFDEAARAMEVGTYSKEPVQTQFGFHVIQVTDKRESAPPPFEAVREQIARIVGGELELEAVRAAREGAKVEIRDEALSTAVETLNAPQAQ